MTLSYWYTKGKAAVANRTATGRKLRSGSRVQGAT